MEAWKSDEEMMWASLEANPDQENFYRAADFMTERGEEDLAYALVWCGYWRAKPRYECGTYLWYGGDEVNWSELPEFLDHAVMRWSTSFSGAIHNLALGLKHVRSFVPSSMESLICKEPQA